MQDALRELPQIDPSRTVSPCEVLVEDTLFNDVFNDGKGNEAAILYLPDTLEQIYATELYANCLYGVRKIDEAKVMFSKALRGIETEITEAENLKSGIIANLDELKA